MAIIADSDGLKKPDSRISNKWLRTGDLSRWWRIFPPEEGFLQFPFALLQAYGVSQTHALAALMQHPKIQRHGTTKAHQADLAHWGCIALRTFQRQLKALTKAGLVSTSGLKCRGPTSITLAPQVRPLFDREAEGYRLQLPKVWFLQFGGMGLNTTDLALYAYYLFRSGKGRGFCTDTFAEIVANLGGSKQGWSDSSAKLESRGMVKRSRMKSGNLCVTLPSNAYDFPDSRQEREDVGRAIIDFYAECYFSRFEKRSAIAGSYSKSAILNAFDLYRTLGRDIGKVGRWIDFIVGTWEQPDKPLTFRFVTSPTTLSKHCDWL